MKEVVSYKRLVAEILVSAAVVTVSVCTGARAEQIKLEKPVLSISAPQTVEMKTLSTLPSELDLLERCVAAEAGNQSLDGQRMVADVILNRVDDENFPDTIEGVITQKNQFSVVANGSINTVEVTETTKEAVRMELEERGWPELMYFSAGGYPAYGTRWGKVGDHYFCTN